MYFTVCAMLCVQFNAVYNNAIIILFEGHEIKIGVSELFGTFCSVMDTEN